MTDSWDSFGWTDAMSDFSQDFSWKIGVGGVGRRGYRLMGYLGVDEDVPDLEIWVGGVRTWSGLGHLSLLFSNSGTEYERGEVWGCSCVLTISNILWLIRFVDLMREWFILIGRTMGGDWNRLSGNYFNQVSRSNMWPNGMDFSPWHFRNLSSHCS